MDSIFVEKFAAGMWLIPESRHKPAHTNKISSRKQSAREQKSSEQKLGFELDQIDIEPGTTREEQMSQAPGWGVKSSSTGAQYVAL